MRRLVLLLPLLFAGCASPSSSHSDQTVDLGRDTVGEACIQTAGLGGATDIYCGAWQQPSAHVRGMGPAGLAELTALMNAGPWRTAIDGRYLCGAPQPATLGGAQGLRMACTGRFGGWPYTAIGAVSGGQAWLADGVVSAVPAIAQSVAVLSGQAAPQIVTNAAVIAAQAEREGGQARATGDSRQFDYLMLQGSRANLADNPAAAESAYGAAVAVQEKALGRDNPNLADPLMHLALQLSNEGRYAEADGQFARAETLAPRQQGDATLSTRLLYYEALHAYNQGKRDASLALLQRADAGYIAAIDPAMLRVRPAAQPGSRFGSDLQDFLGLPSDRQNRTGLVGLIEARRYEGVVLRDLGRLPESNREIASARDLARNARLEVPGLDARLSRSAAMVAAQSGDRGLALTEFTGSESAFRRAYPGSRPLALAGLLNAAELVRAGDTADAVEACRAAVQVLVEVKSGYAPDQLAPCLDAYAAEAAKAGAPQRQAVLADMFLAAQVVRTSKTEQQITQFAARLGASTRNSKVGEAIRKEQDAAVALATVRRRREDIAEAVRGGAPEPPEAAALAKQEDAAVAEVADRERDLQAAAPNYGQFVQQVTPAASVLKLLQPDEALLVVTLTSDGGWSFLLHDGIIDVGAIKGGEAAVDPLVSRIRAAMTPQTPAFDTEAARSLYGLLLGGLSGRMEAVTSLTVAPTGSLLSLPFGVLLTGPADPAQLAAAPWLARRMAIGHVPSPASFIALRQVAGVSRAPHPWFGFGDFRPVTLAQARRSFGPSCGQSAELMAHLPPLPSARQELAVAAKLLDASADDELLGPAFTVPAVQKTDLSGYRVVHFATHAILPSDLKCQEEPAIVTSAPSGAVDASGALLTASDLTQIKLDADLVILSACNSGGADGKLGGESLSSLARSFFYGGARGLLITHWEVSDQVATFIIADTLRRMKAEPGKGTAAALQGAQIDLLDRAGKSLPAEFGHPFYWAPFALIGQSGTPAAAPARSARL